jgi:hypothetical protein
MEGQTMSEAVTESAAEVDTEPQGDPVELGDGGKKALEAERRRANALEKQLKAFQTQAEAQEASKLTELERAQKAANDAAAQLAEYQRTTIRQKVALEKGLPASLVGRLQGDDEEALAADADALLALLNAPTSPKPDPSQGAKAALPLNGDALEQALRNKLGIR